MYIRTSTNGHLRTTATSHSGHLSQRPPLTTATSHNGHLSQRPPLTTATSHSGHLLQRPPLTAATSHNGHLSQRPPLTAPTSHSGHLSQRPPLTTAFFFGGQSIHHSLLFQPLDNGHLSTLATFFCPQGGCCREVQLYFK